MNIYKLTDRQSDVLAFIIDYRHRHGSAPTKAEIADHFGFKSINASADHVKALARKGAIRLRPGLSRGIELP